jgi:hypothetical protein
MTPKAKAKAAAVNLIILSSGDSRRSGKPHEQQSKEGTPGHANL